MTDTASTRGINELCDDRDDLDTLIHTKLGEFLFRLNAMGGFAPSITKRAGHDTISEVTCEGEVVTVCYTNVYAGDVDHGTINYPAFAVDHPSGENVQKVVDAQRAEATAEAARKEQVRVQEEQAQLRQLRRKYPGV